MSSAELAYVSRAVVSTGSPDKDDSETPDIRVLVSRAQTGDKQAFSTLYRLHVKTVYRYISYRVRNQSVAEDLTAEVFLKILRKISTFEWRGIDFSAWVIRIARNVLLDYLKASGTRLEIVGIGPGELEDKVIPGSDLEALDTLDREALHKALNKLRPEHQEVLYLRFLQGLSSLDTAKVMKKSEGAIRVLQFRALKQLCKVLKAANLEIG